MLAFFRRSNLEFAETASGLAERLALSLGMFQGRPASWAAYSDSIYLYCDVRRSRGVTSSRIGTKRSGPAPLTALARSPSGLVAMVDGEIDNSEELAAALHVGQGSAPALFMAAFEKWGDEADLRCIGDYSSLLALPDGRVRLSRSPWRGPPLHYYHADGITVVSSVPRVLFAAGIPEELDERKLVDNLYCNLSEDRGWYRGTHYVDIGQRVWLDPGEPRRASYFYDHLARRETTFRSHQQCVEEVDALLREACRNVMIDAKQPGIFLSGGLDSSNVAMRAVDFLPPGKTLKSFTFRPHPEFAGPDSDEFIRDEWPAVQELVAREPRIDAFAARGHDFDEDWDKLFLAIGQAPVSLPNMSVYTPVAKLAAREGCDVMIDAGMGNLSFSNSGAWGYSEYLRTGQWKELFAAIKARTGPGMPFIERFIRLTINPMLPDWLWRYWRHSRGESSESHNALIGAVHPAALERHKARERAIAAKAYYVRGHFQTRKSFLEWCVARGDMHVGDMVQGYEQIYGFRWRDVSAYRPLVEYCLGLPTKAFLHQGVYRWLGRELGKGLLPESLRMNRAYGMQNHDWHQRITPRLEEIALELDAASKDDALAAIIDFDRLKALIENWPERESTDLETMMSAGMALPRAVMTARFYKSVYRRND